jgi:dTDP-4-dehydrorhamnose reductase
MKMLITGANGQLAKTFSHAFDYDKDTLFLFTKKDLDITNRKQVLKKISNIMPDIVLHFASMTRGDDCAKYPEKAYDINVNGTKNVVDACKSINAQLLFISTNEVFDGKKKTAYYESDTPRPITVAGQTKYEAEKIVIKNLHKYFIVRTSWLFGKWSNNFLNTVLNMARSNMEIKVVVDEISSPTYSVDLCYAIKKLISTKKYGIYHLSNAGKASRFDFAKKAFAIRLFFYTF